MMRQNTTITARCRFFLIVVLLAGLDQLVKYLVVIYLRDQTAITLIPGILELYYIENHGAAFGILQGRQWFFIILALVVLFAGAWIYPALRDPGRGENGVGKSFLPLRIACVLICAGGIGNLIDRLRLGYVIDYIYVSLIRFPVFNLADIYVTTGCALALILLLFVYKEEDLETLKRNRR